MLLGPHPADLPLPLRMKPVDAREFDRLCADLAGAALPRRTERLVRAPVSKKGRKLVEEAAEVALDAVHGDRQGVVNESVDLLYHLAVIWRALGIDPAFVWAEMARRRGALGICEKLPKARRPGRKAQGT